MDSNKDDAERCLDMASKALEKGDLGKASRLVEKSRRMNPDLSQSQDRLSAAIQLAKASPSSSSSSSSSSRRQADNKTEQNETTSSPSPSSSTHQVTPQMKTAVQRVQRLTKESHYKVLSIERDANESTIKKAYRRLALQLHPDRNFAPGADEAFKRVSAAFVVLSDSSKRSHYDQFGTDPDTAPSFSNTRQHSATTASNVFMNGVPLDQFFQTRGGGVSADDLFDMLFNGNTGFNGAGIRVNSNGFQFTQPQRRRRTRSSSTDDDDDENEINGRRTRRRARTRRHIDEDLDADESLYDRLKPMIYLVLFMFFSYWLSGNDDYAGNYSKNGFSLQRTRFHSVNRMTKNGITFYTHPSLKLNDDRSRRKFWYSVDRKALNQFDMACKMEKDEERDLEYRSKSWLVGSRARAIYRRQYQQFRKPSCVQRDQLLSAIKRNGR